MERNYTAEINVNGVTGYAGGSNAEDLANGVKACVEAIEEKMGIVNEPCECEIDIDEALDNMVLGICSALGIDL